MGTVDAKASAPLLVSSLHSRKFKLIFTGALGQPRHSPCVRELSPISFLATSSNNSCSFFGMLAASLHMPSSPTCVPLSLSFKIVRDAGKPTASDARLASPKEVPPKLRHNS